MNEQTPVKGYKVFNPDWTCRAFQYVCPGTFEEAVIPSTCNAGFHFCLKAADCFNYYDFDAKNKVAEVIALGDVDCRGDKCCTNKIQIVREVPWSELLEIVNTGKGCSGLCNSGNWNSGDWNSGVANKCDYSNGVFCNEADNNIRIFNRPSGMSLSDFYNSRYWNAICSAPFYLTEWIGYTQVEKEADPKKELVGGYLKTYTTEEAWANWWKELSEENKEIIKEIPNFDAEIFKDITGIEV